MAVAARRGEPSRASLWFGRNVTGWIFLIPALFFFVGWAVLPIVRVFYYSFTDYHFIAAPGTPTNIIGLRNYIDAIQDPIVWMGLLRAGVFTLFFLPFTIFIPLIIAIMIDRVRSAQGVVDFLDVGVGAWRWPTFNVADSAITIGAVALAVSLWAEGREAERAKEAGTAAT